jgi:hypothetical protein|tara:strand:+ start:221 stop:829 length:609 start_codon:yes stop_codon:yes gene_type:complete
MISLSEIDTTVKRATKAVGFSWGIAEEVGKSISLLEMFGLPGLKNLNQYFKAYKGKKFQNVSLISKSNSSKISYCPIISGINFLDQVFTLNEMIEIDFENVAFPILLVPFLSKSSEIIGKKIFLKIDERKYLLNFNQSIFSNHLDREVVNNAKKVKIVFIENENTFSKSEWNDLYSLSKETFVDESEELKKTAAGAGLTDND